MAFSDYLHIEQVQREFGIVYREEQFIVPSEYAPPANFLHELQFNMEHLDVYSSEASRVEMIIGPTLRELYKNHYQHHELWIQKPITYNEKLTGVPDYLIAKRSALGKTVLGSPLLIVVEAKKNDFQRGWGQCLAELVAIQKLNDCPEAVHGIVTDGKWWEFGRLNGELFIKNRESYTIDNLTVLFGALDVIFHASLIETQR